MKANFLGFYLSTLLLGIVACSDDTGDSVNSQNGSFFNKEDVNTESVQNIRDLGTCSKDNEGSQVYVKNADAYYTCTDKVWKLTDENDPEEAKSSSSEKVVESSDSKSPSSSSADVKSSSSEKVVESSDSKSPTSSSAEAKSSSSEKVIESSDSKSPSSSSADVKSSSSSKEDMPIAEVGATLENVSVCNAQNEGMLVYIQLDDAVYECHAGEYREIEYNLDAPSSSSSSSSSSEPSETYPTKKTTGLLSIGKFDSTFVDNRDGQTYGLVKIGPFLWMGENLNYVTEGGNADDRIASWCYNNDPAYCERGGRLYLWSAAMNLPVGTALDGLVIEDVQGICPEGLRMPTPEEMEELAGFLPTLEDMQYYGFSMDLYGFHGFTFGNRSQSGYPKEDPSSCTQSEMGFWGESAFWTSAHNGHDFIAVWFYSAEMQVISGNWTVTRFRNQPSQRSLANAHAISIRCMTRTEQECTENIDGKIMETEKALMICDQNRWRPASAQELTNHVLGDSLCNEQGKVAFTHNRYEVCDEGKWRFATKAEYNMGLEPCENWEVGLGKIDKDEYFICRNNTWSPATRVDLAVGEKKCSWANQGEVIRSTFFPDDFYACGRGARDADWVPANDMQKDTYSYNCSNSVVVNGIFNKEIKYVCRNNTWDYATEKDIEFDGHPCTNETSNKLIWGKTTPDRIFACAPNENWEFQWQDFTKELSLRHSRLFPCTHDDRDSIFISWKDRVYFACTSPQFVWTVASKAQLAMKDDKCTDETKGLVKQGSDSEYYTCSWSGWTTATTTEYDTYGKECNVSAIVPGNINKDIMYSCNKFWHEATEDDYDVEGIKCEPGIIVSGKINNEKNYACYAGYWREATDFDYDVEGYECSELGEIKLGKVEPENQYVCEENGWVKMDVVEDE